MNIAAALEADQTVKVTFNDSGNEREATVTGVNDRDEFNVAWGENDDFATSVSGADVLDAWIEE